MQRIHRYREGKVAMPTTYFAFGMPGVFEVLIIGFFLLGIVGSFAFVAAMAVIVIRTQGVGNENGTSKNDADSAIPPVAKRELPRDET